jgi:hypothetical protein
MDAPDLLQQTQKLINFLLRYVVAGGSAILAFGLVQKDGFDFLRVGTEISSLLLLLFILVIGPTIYSIHRAFCHFVILHLFIFLPLKAASKLRVGFWKVDSTLTNQLNKWRADSQADNHKWIPTFEGWAAQIHFLYCSAWGIGFALLLVLGLNSVTKYAAVPALLVIMMLLLITAGISDCRLTNEQITRTIEDRKTKS